VADDFARKAPPCAEVGTFHSFCFAALRAALGVRELTVDKSQILLDSVAAEGISRPGKYQRAMVAKLVGIAKGLGYDPAWSWEEREGFLLDALEDYDIEVYGQARSVVQWASMVLEASLERSELIDYDDMLWLAYHLKVPFPGVDLLMIDECQDLSPVQHALLCRLNPRGRTIAVGDRYQSIYGFRGADTRSIPRLIEVLRPRVLPLTVTWRCPRSHVEYARELVPEFSAHESVGEGSIVHGRRGAVEYRGGDMVICKRNAPLVAEALQAMGEQIPAYVRGRAFGDSLGAIVRKLGSHVTIAGLLLGLRKWLVERLEELEAREAREDQIEKVQDQAAALEAVAESCASPAEVPMALARVFEEGAGAAGRVCFSSVHRAKGCEARRVVHLQVEAKGGGKATEDKAAQGRNLEYVARTRSLESLELVPIERESFSFMRGG
jgi:superfamily I DNA/RNA helicase